MDEWMDGQQVTDIQQTCIFPSSDCTAIMSRSRAMRRGSNGLYHIHWRNSRINVRRLTPRKKPYSHKYNCYIESSKHSSIIITTTFTMITISYSSSSSSSSSTTNHHHHQPQTIIINHHHHNHPSIISLLSLQP